MSLAVHRFAAPLVAWIPDLSVLPPRRRIAIGVAASLFLHVLALLLLMLLSNLLTKANLFQSVPVRKEIELTVIPFEPEEKLLTIAPMLARPFLDSTGLDISKVAPENFDFESNENMIAASELPAAGDIPLPSQQGRDLPFATFKSQRALFGSSANPFPAGAESTSIRPSEPSPKDSDVSLQPLPETPKTAAAQPRSTPAPAATPPPKAPEKTPEKPDAPAIASATPPPFKTVDKTKEDEIALVAKPAAIPPPKRDNAEWAQTLRGLAPPLPNTPAAPKADNRQALLVTPAPKTQPVHPPATQLEQEQTRLEGSISNRGKRAVSSAATPLGKYRKQVIDAIGSRWQRYVKDHADMLALGSAHVSFFVDTGGQIRSVQVEANTSNQSFADICERAIREAEIQPPPPDAVAPLRDGRIEYSINFTLYSLYQ